MQNIENGTGCGGQGSPLKVIGNITVRESTYDYLVNFNGHYLEPLTRYSDLSKVPDFHLPHRHLAPRLGWLHSNCMKISGISKLVSLGYCALWSQLLHLVSCHKCKKLTSVLIWVDKICIFAVLKHGFYNEEKLKPVLLIIHPESDSKLLPITPPLYWWQKNHICHLAAFV